MASLSLKETEVQLDYQFKILLIGDSGVGKTSIMNRFTENKFNVEIKSTIGVEYSKKTMVIDQAVIQASIWDTAGQERFRSLAKNYYKGAIGALLVFDVTRPHTLENIQKIWLQEVEQHASKNIKMILIGNKSDLTVERIVKQEEAVNFSKTNNLAYMETSALNNQNIDQAFETLVREIYSEINSLPSEIRPKNLTQRKEHTPQVNQNNNLQIDKKNIKKKRACCE
ncbi:Rab-family small GTPase (macronuclear) [Tetrahymena thermophila SB210]|uniref:Rab-family small GTPase n=2 Tax=Tetrahymena thermophila TaxID=5911 RepID=I7M021_TETTS|nr:Rab-family small GTPase [Tetrahymena thermophila SB210]EAR85334.1 Rab-family small GTPase [Tetrahymena thermophila SB210]BAJ21306.1 Rab-family small GTPase Rab11I [Tetrahymena thermophila]|eukprot:XP_001032997.1 Rab-family small GTPase [Tetrahymena thermophila SB210]